MWIPAIVVVVISSGGQATTAATVPIATFATFDLIDFESSGCPVVLLSFL